MKEVRFLSIEEIQEMCPVAFYTKPSNPSVTEDYVHIHSGTVISDLEKLGWKPVSARMRSRRKSSTVYSYHMLVFQNPELGTIVGKDADTYFPQLILTNSHDGLNAFSFSVGLYRLVCSNGLVVCTDTFTELKIKHRWYSFEELRRTITDVVKGIEKHVDVMGTLKKVELTEEQKQNFATKALMLRTGVLFSKISTEHPKFSTEVVKQLLIPVRDSDKNSDLWTVFNVLQEKLVKGTFQITTSAGKSRKVRPIVGFEKELSLNRNLFKLMMSYIN